MPKARLSADERQLRMFRRMTPEQKLKLAAQLRQTDLRLLEAGIRSREGNLSRKDMRLRVLQHILPPRLFSRFYARAG